MIPNDYATIVILSFYKSFILFNVYNGFVLYVYVLYHLYISISIHIPTECNKCQARSPLSTGYVHNSSESKMSGFKT